MNQSQREALLDLLVLASYMDNHISLTENQALESAINQIGWESPRPREIAFLNGVAAARAAAESADETAAFVQQRAALFVDAQVQAKALAFLNLVLERDGLSAEETEFFHQVKDAFPA